MNHVVKRGGHTEAYDQRKLYATVFSACIAVRVPEGEAELVAEKVCQDLDNWMKIKKEVTSHDIHRVAVKHLRVYNPDAAYIYEHHRNIS